MNFPNPPSFHDPLFLPPPSPAAPITPGGARQHQQLPVSSLARAERENRDRDRDRDREREREREREQLLSQYQQLQHLQQLPLPPPPPPPQLQSSISHTMNGMNGGNMGPGGMVGLPTPAGHQAELNYIYGIVEELSRQLSQNQRIMEEVVSGVGRVRSRARTYSLGNEDMISAAADEVKAQDQNMDTLVSILTEALEKAKYSRDANAALLTQYAAVLGSTLKQFHEYKARHVADVAAWHRSYRAQLAEARAENSRLREQIWEMQAHAGAANELLRKFRTKFDEDQARWDRRVQAKAARQELRFWKRMAMPHMADDDPYWSDDDDLVDPAEKDRLEDIRRKVAEQQLLAQQTAQQAAGSGSEQVAEGGAGGEEGDQNLPHAPNPPPTLQQQLLQLDRPGLHTLIGSVPMQRDDSGALGVPFLPPRPSSAASSTGSTGQ